jgi:hypothetical protein
MILASGLPMPFVYCTTLILARNYKLPAMPFKRLIQRPDKPVMLSVMAWVSASAGFAAQTPQTGTQLPHLEKRGTVTQLLVDGQPFLMLPGELHNSSSSSIQYMEPVWSRLAAAHLNTVLAPVSMQARVVHLVWMSLPIT